MTDTTGPIADLTWDEVSRARDASGHAPVRLEEALADYPELRFNIDAKAEGALEPLVSLARRNVARVCLASFSDTRLARIRAAAPEVATSMGRREIAAMVAISRLPLGRATAVATSRLPAATTAICLQVPIRHRGIPVVTRRLLDLAHALGLGVHVWTVDDPAMMVRLFDLGVDGLVTDVPSTALRVLDERAR